MEQSKDKKNPNKNIGDNLNYNFTYIYDKNYAHRLISAGDRYYKYDSNGNIICEQDGSFESNGEEDPYYKINKETEDVYSTDYGWGLFKEEDPNGGIKGSRYCRTYTWNERNQLISSIDANYNTAYVYGQDGQRTNKYTQSSETLYFNKMWTHHTDSGNNVYGGQTAKNIYLGETRIVTKLNSGNEPKYQEEYWKQYYYHSDHLGSASLISDYKGDEYQRIEYTPYGETWVEKTDPKANLNFLPYKFTAKEMDEETGLYYYGARYLDPRYSMWISTDPALGEYIPKAPVNEEAKRYNQNLPGMGGVFNHINANLYHYAGNNPIKYKDPTGNEIVIAIGAICISAEALIIAGLCITAVAVWEVYVQSPEGQRDFRAFQDAVATGFWELKNTVERTITTVKAKVTEKAEAKAQAKTKAKTNYASAIRFQLQTGSATPASTVRVSTDKLGVKKREAYGALAELYAIAVAQDPGLARCEDFKAAIIKMSAAVKLTPGVASGGNVMRETFIYQGKEYRIDLENLRGINLVE